MHQFSDSYSMPPLQNWELGNFVGWCRTIFQQMKRPMQPDFPIPGMWHLFLALWWERSQWRWSRPALPGIPHHRNHSLCCRCWETHQKPRLGPKTIQLLSWFLSSQKWVVWIWAGACWLGSLRPHLCFFPCYPEEFLSTITNLIEVPETNP